MDPRESLLVRGGRCLDIVAGQWRDTDVRITAGRIADVAPDLTPNPGEPTFDATGAYVLPGLIDCHVHVTAVTADLSLLPELSPTYVAFGTARILEAMLRRGFTTVRDVGGADYGIHDAQREGLVSGPKVFFGGKALSQTGGHGDPRARGRTADENHPTRPGISQVADGVTAVRTAARDELRKGAHHLKMMASGGVASPTDRIDSTQYSRRRDRGGRRGGRGGEPLRHGPCLHRPGHHPCGPAPACGGSNTPTSSTTTRWPS